MRGVSFRIPSEYNKYLWKIFECVDYSKYTWYISQDEILYFDEREGKASSNFFQKKVLTGKEFQECITKTDYYIYLVNIQAYPTNGEKIDIVTYDDFKKSKCEILFLCADSEYIDLYSKNDEYTKKVFDLCIRNEWKDVKYITDMNDERTGLSL